MQRHIGRWTIEIILTDRIGEKETGAISLEGVERLYLSIDEFIEIKEEEVIIEYFGAFIRDITREGLVFV